MHLLLSLCLLLCLTVPAWGEFSVAEKRALRKLNAAMGPTERGATQLIPSVTQGDLETLLWYLAQSAGEEWHPLLTQAWTEIGLAYFDATRAFYLLLHGNYSEAPNPDFARLTAMPRAAWVTEARERLTRALTRLDRATAPLTQGAALPASAQQARMAQALAALPWARQKLRAVALDQPFLAYEPASHPAIVGPHGDYEAMMSEYAIAAERVLMSGGQLTGQRFAYRVGHRLLSAQAQLRHAALKAALVPLHPAQCGLNDFHLVVQSLRHVLAWADYPGLPVHAKEAQLWLSRSDRTQQSLEIQANLGYVIMHAVGGAWRALQFPHQERLCQPGQPCENTSQAIAPPAWPAGLCEVFP